jgi:hypothetical protein
VSALEKEGAQTFNLGRPTFDLVEDPTLSFPWVEARDAWLNQWDSEKTILLEKSPAYIHRAHEIPDHFDPSRFIVLIRDPYAFCEGNVRRRKREGRDYGYDRSAELWVRCAKSQIENLETLKDAVLVRYEDLTDNLEETLYKIGREIPELNELSAEGMKTFTVRGRTTEIQNINLSKLHMLRPKHIQRINSVLEEELDVLNYFDYSIVPKSHHSSLRAVRSRASVKLTRIVKWMSRHGLVPQDLANKW